MSMKGSYILHVYCDQKLELISKDTNQTTVIKCSEQQMFENESKCFVIRDAIKIGWKVPNSGNKDRQICYCPKHNPTKEIGKQTAKQQLIAASISKGGKYA